MKTVTLLSFIIALALSLLSGKAMAGTFDSIKAQAMADAVPYIAAIGTYSESFDGVTVANQGACKLGRKIAPEDFYNPADAEDVSSFSILMGLEADPRGFIASEFMIASSGRYADLAGPFGAATRTTQNSTVIIYSFPTNYTGVMRESCGSWGPMSKPIYARQAQFTFGPGFIQTIINFQCALWGEKHQIVQTCNFIK